jgi:CRISPR-associated protein (TIGR02710 family)
MIANASRNLTCGEREGSVESAEPGLSFRGAVISVGGSHEPIVISLNQARPGFVLFLVSAGSTPQIEQNILPALAYTPQYNCTTVPDESDLPACYEAARDAIPGWLKERNLSPAEVYVDITGATKPMSAALAMAAAEHFSHFTYVRGKERDKGGLGVVKAGTEEVFRTVNPWDKLATLERNRATWLFRSGYAEAAAEQLRQAAGKCSPELQQELKTLADLADCFASADRFQYGDVYVKYRRLRDRLDLIFSHRSQHQLFVALDQLAEHWNQVVEENKRGGDAVCATLRELLANAERRGAQGRYDDAVARLYRATELFAHGELQRAFGWRFGKPQLLLKDEISKEARKSVDGQYAPKLGVKESFGALRYSPLPEHKGLADRYEEIEPHLQKRNNSILAHGVRPATQEDSEKFWSALLPVVGVTEDAIPRWPELEF